MANKYSNSPILGERITALRRSPLNKWDSQSRHDWWERADPKINFVVPWNRLWIPLAIFGATRVVIYVTVLVASLNDSAPVKGILPKLMFWDGDFYVSIASVGYPHVIETDESGAAVQSSLAFFPIFPMTGRALTAVTNLPEDVSLSITALFAGAVAAALLWSLVSNLVNERAANRATLFYLAFPGAYVWSMTYAESMLAMWSLASVTCLLSRRWWLAGIFAALATATRPNGIAIVACCAWAAGAAIARRREWRALAAPLLAPVGFFAVIAYLGLITGEPGAWFRVEHDGWGQGLDFGRSSVAWFLDVLLWPIRGGDLDGNIINPALCIPLAGLLFFALWKWRPKPPLLLWVWPIALVGFALIGGGPGLRIRFLHSAVPLVAAGGVVLKSWVFSLAIVLLGVSQIALIYITVSTEWVIP